MAQRGAHARPTLKQRKKLQQKAEEHTEEAIGVLIMIMKGYEHQVLTKEGVVVMVEATKPSDRRAAANDILEWGHGKRGSNVVQDDGLPAEFNILSREEKQKLLAERMVVYQAALEKLQEGARVP